MDTNNLYHVRTKLPPKGGRSYTPYPPTAQPTRESHSCVSTNRDRQQRHEEREKARNTREAVPSTTLSEGSTPRASIPLLLHAPYDQKLPFAAAKCDRFNSKKGEKCESTTIPPSRFSVHIFKETRYICRDAPTLTGQRECPTRSAEASRRTLPTRGLLAACHPRLPAQKPRR